MPTMCFFDALDFNFRLLGIDIDDRKVGNSQSILHGLAGGLVVESNLTHKPNSPILLPTESEFYQSEDAS